MTVSFTRTRLQIAQRALGKVIALGAASATSAEYEMVYEAVDLRLKEMHEFGTFWRKVTSVPVTFSLDASIISTSAGAGDILFPIKVTWTNGSTDEPLTIIGPREYAEIEDKTRSGNPEKVIWTGGTELKFYPIPSANGTGKLLYEKITDDSSHGAAVDIDVAMIRPFVDIIKYDIADDFGIPEDRQRRWQLEAERAKREIRKLGALRVDTTPVAVDNFDDRGYGRQESDYGA